MPSFSVRCVFLWSPRPDQRKRHLYEERITLWRAEGVDEAIEKAEREAMQYADEGDRFLNLCQAYALYDEAVEDGIEVFSLLRESDLEPEEYLSAFFDTGMERAN